MKSLFGALCALATVASGNALAQNNQLVGGVFGAISSDELVSIFTSSGISSRYLSYEDGNHFVEVSSDALTAVIALRACDGATSASRCIVVQPFVLFSGTGLTLAMANQLNIEKFDLASVMLLPDGNALVGLKLLLEGGVTETNLRNNLGAFFLDVAKFAEAVEPGLLAMVNYEADSPYDYRTAAKAIAAMDERSPNALGAGASAAGAIGRKLEGLSQ